MNASTTASAAAPPQAPTPPAPSSKAPSSKAPSSKAPSSKAPAPQAAAARSALGDLDTLIRNPRGLDAALLDPAALPRWLHGLIRLSVLGLALHGLVVGGIAWLGGWSSWLGGLPVVTLPLTLVASFLLTLAVCLPSFYFYTQLSGLDVPLRFVVVQALRVQAHTSVLLLGMLPIYAAVALATVLPLDVSVEAVIHLGLALPFLVGLSGITALLRSFKHLLPAIPITHARRGRFLLRMVLAWGAVFSVVAPVAMWRIGSVLAGWIG